MRNPRLLGTEIIEFIDGTTQEIKIHAVSGYTVDRITEDERELTLDAKKNIKDVNPNISEVSIRVLTKAIGTEQGISLQDWKNGEIQTSPISLYQKYFKKEISNEKKVNTSDVSETQD